MKFKFSFEDGEGSGPLLFISEDDGGKLFSNSTDTEALWEKLTELFGISSIDDIDSLPVHEESENCYGFDEYVESSHIENVLSVLRNSPDFREIN